MAESAGNNQIGVAAGILVSTGGIVGALGFGIFSTWIKNRLLNTFCLVLAGIAHVGLASSFGTIGLALALAAIACMLTNAGVAGYYTIVPPPYSAKARASGFGWMIGVGRLVSIAAPILVGYLIAAGMPRSSPLRRRPVPSPSDRSIAIGYSSRPKDGPLVRGSECSSSKEAAELLAFFRTQFPERDILGFSNDFRRTLA
ncbi:hypothetical protein [Arthrobacter sp. AZCC_0090]|uniref:hypothetical protein n=1 Tax=Arthrobacter sp. AZCC_0090 TaxID=2735881 RepID=UPI0018054A19|nr:hypothetical protein [Arthrobacter sp. AZCC_0090]MBB6406468.1 hypothetical protein [Arthrobacter sp. AZCC_0090]